MKHSNFEITVKIREKKKERERRGKHIRPTQGLYLILSHSGVFSGPLLSHQPGSEDVKSPRTCPGDKAPSEPGGKRGKRSEAQWVPVGMPQGKALREKGPTISLRDQPSPAVGSSRASKRTGTQVEVKVQKSCRTRWLRALWLQSKPSRAGLAATHWILFFPKT